VELEEVKDKVGLRWGGLNGDVEPVREHGR